MQGNFNLEPFKIYFRIAQNNININNVWQHLVEHDKIDENKTGENGKYLIIERKIKVCYLKGLKNN